jgi:hypothetical protein
MILLHVFYRHRYLGLLKEQKMKKEYTFLHGKGRRRRDRERERERTNTTATIFTKIICSHGDVNV